VLGAPWQRCTVHFLTDLRGHARKDQHYALGDAVAQLESRLPKIAALLEGGRARRGRLLRVRRWALAQAAIHG
jgi:hypothetical protein